MTAYISASIQAKASEIRYLACEKTAKYSKCSIYKHSNYCLLISLFSCLDKDCRRWEKEGKSELRHSNCKEEKKQCRGCLLLLRCRKLRLHTLLGNAVPEVRGCKTLRSALSPPPSSGGLSRNPTPVFLIYLVKPPLLSEMNSRWNPGLSEVSELIPGNCVEQSDTVYAAHPHCNFSPFIFSTIKM